MTTLDYVQERIALRPLGNRVYAFGKQGRWLYDPDFDRHTQAGPMIVHAIRSELKKERVA
jgi:hypothetical protein